MANAEGPYPISANSNKQPDQLGLSRREVLRLKAVNLPLTVHLVEGKFCMARMASKSATGK